MNYAGLLCSSGRGQPLWLWPSTLHPYQHLNEIRMKKGPNWDRVTRLSAGHSLCFVNAWLPYGNLDGRNWMCGGLNGTPGNWLSVDLVSGEWFNLDTLEGGKDLQGLRAAIIRDGYLREGYKYISDMGFWIPRRNKLPSTNLLHSLAFIEMQRHVGVCDNWRTWYGK